jgi:hypothetical protein
MIIESSLHRCHVHAANVHAANVHAANVRAVKTHAGNSTPGSNKLLKGQFSFATDSSQKLRRLVSTPGGLVHRSAAMRQLNATEPQAV